MKKKLLDDTWWDQVDYIIAFTDPIHEMLRFCVTDQPSLHLVFEMWDTMIFQVKTSIYKHENKREFEDSSFWNVVRKILEDRWNKSNTPLHCLTHSLNQRCMTKEWQKEHPHLTPPQSDHEISKMLKMCLKHFFPNEETCREVNIELAKFFKCFEDFGDEDSLRDRWTEDLMGWWVTHRASFPHIQSISMRLFGKVSSSSCIKRNWSPYSFIHSTKRNQITPQCAEDLVYVHSNLRLLSRKIPEYIDGETKMWDVGGAFEFFDEVGILGIANLSIDEPELKFVIFNDEINEELCDESNLASDLDK